MCRNILAVLTISALACSESPTSSAPAPQPDMLTISVAEGVVEVGNTYSFVVELYAFGAGFVPNVYFDLDSARWSTANAGIASVASVQRYPMPDTRSGTYFASEGKIIGNAPGITEVAVSHLVKPLVATATVYVMPPVRSVSLRATKDTIYAGESSTVFVAAELADGSDATAYFRWPYLMVSQEGCTIACPATSPGGSLGAEPITVTANGLFSGHVTFHAHFGQQPALNKAVVVFAGPRPAP